MMIQIPVKALQYLLRFFNTLAQSYVKRPSVGTECFYERMTIFQVFLVLKKCLHFFVSIPSLPFKFWASFFLCFFLSFFFDEIPAIQMVQTGESYSGNILLPSCFKRKPLLFYIHLHAFFSTTGIAQNTWIYWQYLSCDSVVKMAMFFQYLWPFKILRETLRKTLTKK